MVSFELSIEIEKDVFVLSRARDKEEHASSWALRYFVPRS